MAKLIAGNVAAPTSAPVRLVSSFIMPFCTASLTGRMVTRSDGVDCPIWRLPISRSSSRTAP